jgi:hypothetical protein
MVLNHGQYEELKKEMKKRLMLEEIPCMGSHGQDCRKHPFEK